MRAAVLEILRRPGVRPLDPAHLAAGRSAATMVVVTGTTGLISVATIRLIVGHFGVDAYAQYGLLVSLAALVPFADLGLASVVINAIAGSSDPDADPVVTRTMVSALRLILCSGIAMACVALVITVAGWWPLLLGSGLLPGSGPRAALLCALAYACTLPLAVGQRTLTALGLNSLQIVISGLAGPLMAASIVVLVLTGSPAGGYLAVVSFAGRAAVAGIGSTVAARRLPRTSRRVLREITRLRSVPSLPVMRLAWPALVQMVALPLAMQTDRLLLSHLASLAVLAEYSLAASLFGLVLQVVNAAGLALWPVFARARTAGQVRSPVPLAGAFAAGALLVGCGLGVLMPLASSVLTGGRIHLSPLTTWTFVALVVVQAAKYPLGMYLTDPAGMRFQVVPILVMVPLNLGLSWMLVAPLGAAGPVLGSTVAVGATQVLASWWYVRRDLRRRRAQVVASTSS